MAGQAAADRGMKGGTSTADVVVIGLGAVGSATLHRLALAGVRAIGIDRFNPPHDRGSTHGETRITRLAVAEGPEYVPLVRRSHAIWRELEAEIGRDAVRADRPADDCRRRRCPQPRP